MGKRQRQLRGAKVGGANISAEDGLIRAILSQPDDDPVRLVYADWLEERGDIRAEYLRLVVALERLWEQAYSEDLPSRMRHVPEIARLRIRLRELQARITTDWLCRMHRGPIEGCGFRNDRACPGRWEHFQETDNSSIRMCNECGKKVVFCQSVEEVAKARQRGRRVAEPLFL
jgi:uncharacterized protein (TIGR02996 family)